MKLPNTLLLLCQILLAAVAFALWPVEPQQEQSSNCAAPAGHPERAVIDGEAYRYVYDAKGRVIRRTGKHTEYRMVYAWNHDEPVSVSEIIRDDRGAEIARRESSFIYDGRHNMVGARNSEGANVRFRHNAENQIIGIHDVTTGTRLEIGYDLKCNEPARLTLSGGESVTISYKQDCEINKVGENLDPVTSMRIASLFNRLLEASSPAGMGFLQQNQHEAMSDRQFQ